MSLTPPTSSASRANNRVALYCLAVLILMTAAGFAAVPLYRIFCQRTGFGGTVSRATSGPTAGVLAQTLTVNFDTNVRGLPWAFNAEQGRQTNLWSATMPRWVQDLAKRYCTNLEFLDMVTCRRAAVVRPRIDAHRYVGMFLFVARVAFGTAARPRGCAVAEGARLLDDHRSHLHVDLADAVAVRARLATREARLRDRDPEILCDAVV